MSMFFLAGLFLSSSASSSFVPEMSDIGILCCDCPLQYSNASFSTWPVKELYELKSQDNLLTVQGSPVEGDHVGFVEAGLLQTGHFFRFRFFRLRGRWVSPRPLSSPFSNTSLSYGTVKRAYSFKKWEYVTSKTSAWRQGAMERHLHLRW